MGPLDRVPVSLTITVSHDAARKRVILTTWGVAQGRYGSLGRVSVPAGDWVYPETRDDLARTVLTALYGLDYDL